jgi:hypothetical protein
MLKKDKKDRMIENKPRKGKKMWKEERIKNINILTSLLTAACKILLRNSFHKKRLLASSEPKKTRPKIFKSKGRTIELSLFTLCNIWYTVGMWERKTGMSRAPVGMVRIQLCFWGRLRPEVLISQPLFSMVMIDLVDVRYWHTSSMWN